MNRKTERWFWRRPLSLFWRVILTTVLFHGVAGLVTEITSVRRNLDDLVWGPLLVALLIVPYWAVLFLAWVQESGSILPLIDQTKRREIQHWRVWGGWLVTTAPFALLWLTIASGEDRGAGSAFAGIYVLLTGLSPVAAFVGAVAGDLLCRLYQYISGALLSACR